MKAFVLIVVCITGFASGQDKPRVFVRGKGSEDVSASGAGSGGRHWGAWGANASVDSHDEAMEVTKNLQKDCSGVIVTLNQSNSDYTVMLNRESKHNRGLLRTNSQIQVANRLGDIIGTNATRTVGNAAKDACQLVMDDWNQHGHLATAESPAAPPSDASKTAAASSPSQASAASEPTVRDPVQNYAKLQIDSTPPGADIEVDGNFVGNTPSEVQVKEGDHTVDVKKAGFKNWERKMKTSAGSNIHVGAELEKDDSPAVAGQTQ